MTHPDYYQELQLDPTAPTPELARQLDELIAGASPGELESLRHARAMLADPVNRPLYDRALAVQQYSNAAAGAPMSGAPVPAAETVAATAGGAAKPVAIALSVLVVVLAVVAVVFFVGRDDDDPVVASPSSVAPAAGPPAAEPGPDGAPDPGGVDPGQRAVAAGAVPLYSMRSDSQAVGDTGGRVTAIVNGRTAEATGVWVGCDGEPALATYGLDGRYLTLTGDLVLQDHAPAGLPVEVVFTGDGRELASEEVVEGAGPRNVTVKVKGVKTLTMSARTDSSCTVSTKPFGAFVDAELTGQNS